MIKRYPGTVPTRSRAVAHDGLVYAVHTAPTKSPSLYEQTRDALAAIDRTLAEAGSSKSRILRATVYITDMSRKPEMNRAWDEWVDMANVPQRASIGVVLEDKDLVEILVIAAQG
jgi:enamine deaminase RidA (YjgF/YER057c/UK114 family)